MTNDNITAGEDVAAALINAFPEREIEKVLPAGPSWNDRNEAVRVEFADGKPVFLKIAADSDGARITRECAVIDYVGTHCNVVVPTVVTSGTTGEPPYLVTAPMRERSLAAQWQS
ncbi:protein kinase family protein [Natronorubrum halophilum]|uniref:hypothetical protein n=1 Tax=Natronorubrum halophilum TaxID=1702106 RepID=UPI001EE89F3D|nr:hypothetical protein [Natronorubrum halophilum]